MAAEKGHIGSDIEEFGTTLDTSFICCREAGQTAI